MSDVVIALDQGSSSSRALAIDSTGEVVARAQFEVGTRYPNPGWVEHDAEELVSTLERSLDAVLDELPPKTGVAAIGLACQRSTIVLWDARTGRPACPAPSWMDGRAAGVTAPFQDRLDLQGEVHEKTGLYLMPFYSAPKIRFLLDNEDGAKALADKGDLRAGPVSTYALWKLSGGEVFRVDPSMAQRMMLYNIRTGEWDESLLSMFGLSKDCLPDIGPTAGSWCAIKRKGRTMPVLAVMGDQQSAALGQGGGEPGVGVLNYGTGAFFLLHTGEKVHHIPGILTSVAWRKGDRPCSYFMEGTVHAAGNSLKWLQEGLGLLKDVREADEACRKSTHRILALQSLGGLGAPRWDYKTPTVFMGLQAKSRPEDVVRAVTESIAFLISDIVFAIRQKGLGASDLRASGGLGRIDYLLQFQADILQSRIARFKESEVTAMGVASLAAEEAGLDWAGALRGGVMDREFEPELDAGRAGKLAEGWRRFVKAQQESAAALRELEVLG